MYISTLTKAICLLGATLALGMLSAAPAAAQKVDGDDVKDVANDVKDVAETPLEDVGLSKEDIPEVLIDAAKAPYSSEGLSTCNALVAEIAKLDEALGEDYDTAGAKGTGINAKGTAKSVVGSIIPFRGLVREVSGAAGNARESSAARMAGMVRRGYLKGLGQARGCKYPARPKPAE
ncbi:MAG: hypothetical protein AAFR64_00170 [Pseudomonadota bacterium]